MNNKKIIKKLARMMVSILAIMIFTTVTAASASAAEISMGAELRAGGFLPMTLTSGGTGVEEVDSMFNNLYSFISGVVHIVGVLIGLYGLVQVGMSFSQHDPSQRMQGFMFSAGGVIILFSPQILSFIQGV